MILSIYSLCCSRVTIWRRAANSSSSITFALEMIYSYCSEVSIWLLRVAISIFFSSSCASLLAISFRRSDASGLASFWASPAIPPGLAWPDLACSRSFSISCFFKCSKRDSTVIWDSRSFPYLRFVPGSSPVITLSCATVSSDSYNMNMSIFSQRIILVTYVSTSWRTEFTILLIYDCYLFARASA